MEPVDFVKERLDEWEPAARYAGPGQWQRDGINSVEDSDGRLVVYGDGPAPSGAQVDHMVLHDPARVLAQVAAMRAIVDLHPEMLGFCQGCASERFPCRTLRHLTAIWSDHPEYDPSWSPTAA